jgi:hypothetical protein
MTPPLPLPVRVAAGLVAIAVEQARGLPRLALELPVTAVSQALQASMRVQQKVTELAIKGDQVLGVTPPVEDEPAWATFDDDLPQHRNGGRASAVPVRPVSEDARAAGPSSAPGAGTPRILDTAPPAENLPVPIADSVAAVDVAGPDVLPGYASLTIPQLRARLRHLGADDLRALLVWEQAHGDRPPYVTMLSNRIATVTEG